MVLGFLLYEAVDLAWNFGGMTYRGGKYIYNWYYQVPSQDRGLEHACDKIRCFRKSPSPALKSG